MVAVAIYGDRYFACDDGHIYNAYGKRLSGGKNSKGYLCVCLYDSSRPSKSKSFLVHRLIACAFLGESNLTVNHIDGNKLNNAPSNLEYCTVAENVRHASETLLSYSGERNGRCKLSTQQVCEIRASTLSCAELAEKYSVTPDYVRSVKKFKYRVNG